MGHGPQHAAVRLLLLLLASWLRGQIAAPENGGI